MNKKNELNAPLFTGEYYRDSAVCEEEKAANVAVTIYEGMNARFCKKKNCGAKLRRKLVVG